MSGNDIYSNHCFPESTRDCSPFPPSTYDFQGRCVQGHCQPVKDVTPERDLCSAGGTFYSGSNKAYVTTCPGAVAYVTYDPSVKDLFGMNYRQNQSVLTVSQGQFVEKK